MFFPSVYLEKPLLIILSCIIAYLIGSVSTGILISRFYHGPDLHTVGSGSTGATNVQRSMGWKYGLMTFFGDVAKGILACLIAELMTGDHLSCLVAGLFAVLGHNWPCFFGFKGGKGVATTGAVMLYCFPVPALICIALAVALIALIRYVSVGSMFFMCASALLISLTYHGPNALFVILWTIVMALLCIIRHHANIRRLISGTENRLGSKPKQ